MTRATRILSLIGLALMTLGALSLRSEPALARHSMSFMPGDRTRLHAAATARRSWRRTRSARATSRPRVHVTRRGPATEGDEGPNARAVPGGGFTMQDGVLTYPAPSRFQPQNLRRHP